MGFIFINCVPLKWQNEDNWTEDVCTGQYKDKNLTWCENIYKTSSRDAVAAYYFGAYLHLHLLTE